MKFFKEHSYDIVRLFLNQFALAVFGTILLFASTMSNNGEFGIFSLAVSLFSIVFYLYLVFAAVKEMSTKQYSKIRLGKLPYDRFFGLKIMLWAQVPNFIILILMIIGYIFGFFTSFGTSFGVNLFTIMDLIIYFLQSMYQGTIGFIMGTAAQEVVGCTKLLIAQILTVIPALVVSLLAYRYGYNKQKNEEEKN